MPRVQFNPEINYGHILTLLALMVSLAGGWFVLTNTVAQNTLRLDTVETNVAELSTQVAEDRAVAISQQIELARTLTQMQADLTYLRDALDRQEASRQ